MRHPSHQFPNRTNALPQISTSEIDQFVEWCRRARRLRPRTVDSYRDTLEHLGGWLGAPPPWNDLSASTLERYITQETTRGTAPSPSTTKRKRETLMRFYQWAERRGIATINPIADIPAPMVSNRNPNPIRDDVWMDVWTSTLSSPAGAAPARSRSPQVRAPASP